jgi:hypothetical protein
MKKNYKTFLHCNYDLDYIKYARDGYIGLGSVSGEGFEFNLNIPPNCAKDILDKYVSYNKAFKEFIYPGECDENDELYFIDAGIALSLDKDRRDLVENRNKFWFKIHSIDIT